MTIATGQIEKELPDDTSAKIPCLRLVSTGGKDSTKSGFRIGISDDIFAPADRIQRTSGTSSEGCSADLRGDQGEMQMAAWKNLGRLAAAGLVLGYLVGRLVRLR